LTPRYPSRPNDDRRTSVGQSDASRVASRYLTQIAELALQVDTEAVGAVAQLVADTIHHGRTVFVAGNGGSATTAGHVVCDLIGTCLSVGVSAVRVVGLSDNAGVLTALANDIGFEEVFCRQVRLLAMPGDLLLLFSVSGESPNLIQAAQAAQASGARVAVAVGRSDSTLAKHADAAVCLGTNDYGLAEDLHLALNHIIARLLNGREPRLCRD
jgi:D-sedoheptulose 7-phosphate isomerase